MRIPFWPRKSQQTPSTPAARNRDAFSGDIPDYFKQRYFELRGTVTDEVANQLIACLLFHQMGDPIAPIQLLVDSPGGSVTAGLAIVDAMQFVKPAIYVQGKGTVSGMALLILANGTKGHRDCCVDVSSCLTPTVASQKHLQSPEAMKFVEKANQRIISLFASATGRSEEEIATGMRDETHFTAAGLVAFGLIDRVVPATP